MMEQPEVIIRDFAAADLPAAETIARNAWRAIFEGYAEQIGPELLAQLYGKNPQDGKAAQIRHSAEQAPERFIVAVLPDGTIAGFLTYLLDESRKVGIIGNNAVDASLGLKGVGQKLYAEAFVRFRAAGMTAAQVQTGLDDGHAPARRAYERAGFEKHLDNVCYFTKL